jgi:uncharacterized protein
MSTTTSPPAVAPTLPSPTAPTPTAPSPTAPTPTAPTPTASARASRTEVVAGVLGAALAASTGFDGPAPWAPVRGLVALALAAVTIVALRRGRRRGGTALLVLGLLGLIVGAGIGGAHVVKVGVAVTTVAGVTALVTGLASVALALVRLLGGSRWWWKALTVPAVPVVAAGLLLPLTLAVMMTNSAPLQLGDATPADVGLAYEDVRLRTADGEQLAAWYVPSTNGAAVVMLAGAGSTRDDVIGEAAAVAGHGYGVLLLDVRGHGGSTGEAMLLGWYGELDVAPAVDWLTARPDVVDGRIGVVGFSMGGQQAVAAAGADDRIRAVVADGVVGRHLREMQAPSLAEEWMAWLAMEATEAMTSAPDPVPLVDAVRSAAPNPFLVIAAGDVDAEQDFAAELDGAAPDTVDVWVVPGVGHTAAFDDHPEQWEARVVEFLEGSLT